MPSDPWPGGEIARAVPADDDRRPMAEDREDAIETACHNAVMAMADWLERADRDGCSADLRRILAAALNQLALEQISGEELAKCFCHLSRTAAPLKRAQ